MQDPYKVLGVGAGASEAELRAAYRRAVQRHHPDHNGGSPESARRFEEVQDAWMRIRQLRARTPRTPPPAGDPAVEDRLAAMEQELAAARAARASAAAAAAAAMREAETSARPSDEELGYIRTDDSFLKILGDARDGLLEGIREKPVADRAADLLDEVASALRGGPRKHSGD